MSFDTLKILSSIIGMIGGFLGIFIFIDNYILKFKPKFSLSNRLFFLYQTEEKHTHNQVKPLESIILRIEAINGRNKIGQIDDLAVRIYDSRSTFPSEHMLYAENVIERLPSKSSSFNFDKSELSSFSPIPILGRSTKNFVIEFKPEKYTRICLNPEGLLKLDLLFFLPNKGWKYVGTFNPYYFNDHNDQQASNEIIEYSLLDRAVTRKDASKSLKQPEVGIYKGISGKYIGYYLMKPVWGLKRIFAYLFKVIKLICVSLEALIRQISFVFVVLPLIKLKSKTLPRIQFSNPRAHLTADTKDALEKCKTNIKKIAEKINSSAEDNAKISIRDDSSGFSIQRGNLEVKFYKSGDGYIQAHDTNEFPHLFTFSMKLVEYPFGLRLWEVNNKIMTLKSACIHVMDSFILLAH